jgi:hypothetical protein
MFSQLNKSKILFIIIGASLIVISIFFGFMDWSPVVNVLEPIKSYLPMQFDRFYFLSPMLWMIIFGISFSILTRYSPSIRLILIAVVFMQVIFTATKHEYIVNRDGPTVSAFFAESQFDKIKETIDRPINSYRVASIGIYPSVALYNGFYTLDGYWSNYPLDYKHKFRKVIAGELEKDESLKKYFDSWGSRVYLFNNVTKKNMTVKRGNNFLLQDLEYDWNAFYELGGRYILSAVKIIPNTDSSLSFIEKFSDKSSAWDIYLYEVKIN